MHLFAPSFVPSMVASHQPRMSGMSQPEMAPAHTFGAATPIHFGPVSPLRPRTPARQAPEIEPMLHAPRIDRYDRGT